MVASFVAGDFPVSRVRQAKGGRTVSVCVPARDEAATIAGVVGVLTDELRRAGVVDEVVVIDDGSTDDTAAIATRAGATVHAAADLLPGQPGGPGKGQAMWRGVHATSGDIVVFCDADVRSFGAGFVLGLVGPLLEQPDLTFVKGWYQRPLDGRAGEGGRVTELMARPLIATLFPHLAPIIQPLAGECAARREVLEAVPFAGGYAVDLGLLIDVSARWGAASMGQSDLGTRVHRNRSLADLGPQALAILQLGLERVGMDPLPGPTVLRRPAGEAAVALTTLPALSSLRGAPTPR